MAASHSRHEPGSNVGSILVFVSIFRFLLSRRCSRITAPGISRISRHPSLMTENLPRWAASLTSRLKQVERQPGTEVTITQIEIALETPELDPDGRGQGKVPEQRLVVYQLEDGEKQWIGVVPRGDAGNVEPERYQAHLKRRLRQKPKEGQSPYMNSLRGKLIPAKETDEL